MTDFNDFTDLAAIERERDLPPDEPYDRLGAPDQCPTCGSEDILAPDSGPGPDWTCRDCGATSDD